MTTTTILTLIVIAGFMLGSLAVALWGNIRSDRVVTGLWIGGCRCLGIVAIMGFLIQSNIIS